MKKENGKVILEEGDKLNVQITGRGSKGDGVTKHNGLVIFIPNSEVGEEIEIRITKIMNKFAFAEKV